MSKFLEKIRRYEENEQENPYADSRKLKRPTNEGLGIYPTDIVNPKLVNRKVHPYNKKFSIGHWERTKDDDLFYRCYKNSSEQFKKETYDIFFGHKFISTSGVEYGSVMGVQSNERQYKNLLDIQEKYGTRISLTLNDMNRPLKLLGQQELTEFLNYLQKFYDDGVRSCTISHTHLMRMGVLQDRFPDMHWKNTVNHCIRTTQEFYNYVALGYNTIQLDRDYNRNLPELKRTFKEAQKIGVETCLLIYESCMPECPFKTEHDIWQGGVLPKMHQSYWGTLKNTCVRWRQHPALNKIEPAVANPRTGTDVVMHDKSDWDDFANNCDYFKLSGRLVDNWSEQNEVMLRGTEWRGKAYGVDSFKTIYDNNLIPISPWLKGLSVFLKDVDVISDPEQIKKDFETHFWNKPEAITLQKVLKACKNQCYKCHKCDDLFGEKHVQSILEA